MYTEKITPEILARSVIAVPPLARHADLQINDEANRHMLRYLESGGIRNILYGGNANFYHIALSEYVETLNVLQEAAGDDTWIIPSAGPTYGMMMDQAAILRDFDFPTAMVLPMSGLMTSDGVEEGFRRFVEAYGKPAVLYIKAENYISPEAAGRLMADGCVSAIKYALVTPDTAVDPYLDKLLDHANPEYIVSGIGEQPAKTHLKQFGLTGFTAGCVCIAPKLSMSLRAALHADRMQDAESIREKFLGLESLRNRINPVRVLHQAVTLSGIADMGPALPLLSLLSESEAREVFDAVQDLMLFEAEL
jgi:dihydrodipicolinate synthase/N-acetylneuraminate lyase